jgi:hypothetical protein
VPTTEEWLDEFADALGLPPLTEEERETLLALAGVAAHASERTAAPLSCWLVGRSGRPPADALVLGRALAADMNAEPPTGGPPPGD